MSFWTVFAGLLPLDLCCYYFVSNWGSYQNQARMSRIP